MATTTTPMAEDTSVKRSHDLEKHAAQVSQVGSMEDVPSTSLLKRLAAVGVELRGIRPVALEDRTMRPINIFFFWLSASLGLVPVVTGLVGTLFEGLSLEAACLTILFFSLLGAIPPAALGVLGPHTGMRQLVQTRYSFGLYAVGIVALLNLATTTGWTIVSAVAAGQTLSAVSGGGLSWTLGIVIISLAGLFISFMGYKVVHMYERFAWIPALIAIVIMVGCGGHLLKNQTPAAPTKASSVVTYGGIVVSFSLSWASMVSDFCVYVHPDVSKWRIFFYTYAGLLLPTIPLMCLGAAMGGAVGSVSSLADAFDADGTGGIATAMLSQVGGFGRFVAVIIAFTVLGNMAGSMYSISIQFQTLLPFLVKVPRYIFSIFITGVIIGVAVPISHTLETSLENFLGVISYWVAIYVGIFATEHLYFRKGSSVSYDHKIWNVASELPLGIAAIVSSLLPFALIIPCMSQTWYTGPIAEKSGDIGFEVGFVLSVIFYIPLRTLERHMSGR